jgi:hypothetical protein
LIHSRLDKAMIVKPSSQDSVICSQGIVPWILEHRIGHGLPARWVIKDLASLEIWSSVRWSRCPGTEHPLLIVYITLESMAQFDDCALLTLNHGGFP